MSQFKRNIPVTSTLSLAIEGNWERIIFDSIDLMVPSDLMLSELILSPTDNPMWLMNILREYQPPEIEDLESLIKKNPNASEQQIAQVINTRMWDEKLYAIVSLRLYGLPQESPDLESQVILQGFSNQLVSMIEQELLSPSSIDETIADFCAEKKISWDAIRYHQAVVDYCLQILPHPLNYVPNVDLDSAWSVFISDKFDQMESSEEISKHTNPRLADYHERKVEAERQVASLFSDYRVSRAVLDELTLQLKEERPEIFRERFEINSSTVTSNRSYRRSKKPTEKDLLLCRCEFCYEFRTMVRKRGVNPAWHCDEKRCQQKYDAWKKHLVGKGKPSESDTE
jgi:hypothetical protein